jgi:hypothetical protein
MPIADNGVVRKMLAALFAAAAASGCFFYDSRWGEAKRAQQAAAQTENQRMLRPTAREEGPSTTTTPIRASKKLKLRARVTPTYAALYADWSRRIEQTVGDANQILGPTLGIELGIVNASLWRPRATDDDLTALLDELAQTDPGTDVDWVVGFAGSLPRFELSFHQLGMGQLSGKHFVVRAMNDAREYEYAEHEFAELDPEQRTRVYRTRLQHKTSTVFLHELGHTLGVQHEPSVTSLMRAMLDRRLEPESPHDPRRFAQPAPPSSAPHGGTGSPLPGVVAPPDAPELGKLTADDRRVYDRSREEREKGRTDDAWTLAQPLFAKYPDVTAVQDFRCQLAMKREVDWTRTRAECEGLMRLTPGLSPQRPPR